MGTPNFRITELNFTIIKETVLNEQIVQIASKFPSLTKLAIVSLRHRYNHNQTVAQSISPLNQLQNLKHLRLNMLTCAHVRDMTIPKLKTFSSSLCCKNGLIKFLGRHRQIHELTLTTKTTEVKSEELKEIVRFALINLKKLTRFSVYRSTPAMTGSVLALIDEHARPGFVLEQYDTSLSGSYRYNDFRPNQTKVALYMKRHDGEIVM